jgi:hypothetical protein
MTHRERVLKTFKKEKIDKVCWQPRLEHWYEVNKERNTLPAEYNTPDVLQLYDKVDASIRYYYYENGFPLRVKPYKDIKVSSKTVGENKHVTVMETPAGTVQNTIMISSIDMSGHFVEPYIKSIDDFKVIEYIFKNTEYYFDNEQYDRINNIIGDRGTVQFFFPRSPLQRLIIEYAGFENTIFMLMDYPDKVQQLMKVIDESDDQMYDVICKCPSEIIGFGENIDATLDSPAIFQEHLMPYYDKRVSQLHAVGKFCHIHMDGSLKTLLPFIKQMKFDGIEAATPIPQGDVTIEEIKDALGNKILLDGIPALLFLDSYSTEELEKTTMKLLDLFAPNLILGISDEISPVGKIEKVKLVTDMVNKYKITQK